MKRRISGGRVPSLAAVAALATLGALGTAPQGQAQDASLLDVLARATEYVDDLHDRLVGVVMEERYEQRARYPPGAGFGANSARVTLRSDYLLLEPEGSDRPFGFRDVFEANGRPVRDREERLTRLFLNPTASVRRRIQGILEESARHNIGDVERTTNTPTLALLFLGSSYKSRFAFEPASDTSPELGIDEPDDRAAVRAIAFRETWPVTLIRRRGGQNLPASGRYWIEAATGRVLVTDLVLDHPDVDSRITVRYADDEMLGHPVPVEMRERYNNRRTRSRVDGTATYSRFRRFQVQVEEGAAAPE
ncbi:MAG: hypothetical protein OXF93_08820 [Acidobacteria bacterium]|nr:hypothetical protein [Acidobacteriota bacterium]